MVDAPVERGLLDDSRVGVAHHRDEQVQEHDQDHIAEQQVCAPQYVGGHACS